MGMRVWKRRLGGPESRGSIGGGLWAHALALGPALALFGALSPAAAESQPERFDTVILDAGHGGEDTGAKGASGASEKDVVLEIAKALAKRLAKDDLRVVLTRKDDVFVPLEERTAIANDARGDLFLSIHANASPDRSIHGTETYFLALEASDSGAARTASRENESFGEAAGIAAVDDPFIALIGDLIATEHLEESSDLAREIQRELGRTKLRSRGVKQALFVVLTGVQMPAALVEIGFITNRGDERAFKGPEKERIVDALEKAVRSFGRRYDARRGGDPLPASAPGER